MLNLAKKKVFFRNQAKCAMLWLLPFSFRSISLSTSPVQKYSRNIRYTTLRGIQKREGTWEQTAYKIPMRLTNLIIDLKFGDFASIRSVIGQQNRRYPLNQSDAKRKLIVTWSPAFSRVFDSLPVFWKTALSKWINRPREILQPRPIGIKQIGEIEVISFLACTQAPFRFWAF